MVNSHSEKTGESSSDFQKAVNEPHYPTTSTRPTEQSTQNKSQLTREEAVQLAIQRTG